MELVIEFIRYLIWPATLILIVFLFKPHIIEIINSIYKLKFKGFEIERLINEQKENARNLKSENIGSAVNPDMTSKLSLSYIKKLLDLEILIKENPDQALDDALEYLIDFLKNIALDKGLLEEEAKLEYDELISLLKSNKLIGEKFIKLFNSCILSKNILQERNINIDEKAKYSKEILDSLFYAIGLYIEIISEK